MYITQAEVTSQGAELDGLDAEARYSAGIACYLTQRAYVNTDVEMGEDVTPVVISTSISAPKASTMIFFWRSSPPV